MREQIQEAIKHLGNVAEELHDYGETSVARSVEGIVDDLEAAIRPQWVPVAERLPEHNRVVFVICKDSECRIAYHAGAGNWKDDGGWIVHVTVTHWHEIDYPEPPQVTS